MPYCTPQDVLNAWPKVHTSQLVPDELVLMIARGDAVIDAALGVRYGVPFCTDPTQTPAIVKMLSQDLAMLDVFDRMPNTPDWITRRITRDQDILEKLADGTMAVIGTDGSLVAVRTDGDAPASTTETYIPVFGAVPSLSERNDPVRLGDELDNRQVIWPEDVSGS